MKFNFLFISLIVLSFSTTSAQDANYLSMSWKDVATKMPDAWYGSDEAKKVAENVILNQKTIGGWEKNKEYHLPPSDSEIKADKSKIGATFDNGATITELKFLAKVYSHNQDPRYKESFIKGLEYIFISQYDNGGWPQFFPLRGGNGDYSMHITYNDDAMVNTMKFLKEIYAADEVKTLAPAKARSYELPSFSGSESVRIVQLLMDLEDPSEEIIASVDGAVKWFETHKIEGIKIETEINTDGNKNRIVVEDKDATALWARFYDLNTEKTFFCDRDGIKKNSLAEIGYERRNGYSWYVNSPEKLLQEYNEWKRLHPLKKHLSII